MAQSTRTKLDVANQVLLNVNERPLNNIQGSPFGIRLEYALNQALNEIDTLNDWSWLYRTTTSLTWTNEFANLEPFQRILDVRWLPTNGNLRRMSLNYLPRDQFDWMEKTSYDSNNPQRPVWWTIGDDKSIGVNPYPTDTLERVKIEFRYVGFTTLPANDQGTWPMPEEYLNLVVMRASAIFALTHLADANTAGTFSQAFEAQAQRLRDRDRTIPSEGVSMFKPRRI